VERSVEVVRRKAFAFRDTFATLEEANRYLLEVCQRGNQKAQEAYGGQSAAYRLAEERAYLLPSLPPFDAASNPPCPGRQVRHRHRRPEPLFRP